MRLVVENIGKIARAEINLGGISVIAGVNNTGKSTLSKALYCAYNFFADRSAKLKRQKISMLVRVMQNYDVDRLLSNGRLENSRDGNSYTVDPYHTDFISELFTESIGGTATPELVARLRHKLQENIREQGIIEEVCERAEKIFDFDGKQLQEVLLNDALIREFYGQINNRFQDKPASIELKSQSNRIAAKFEIQHDRLLKVDSGEGGIGTQEAIYLDDVPSLNESRAFNTRLGGDERHNIKLQQTLDKIKGINTEVELLNGSKNQKILALLNSACPLSLRPGLDGRIGMSLGAEREMLHYGNLSQGLKSLMVIKAIVENGLLAERGLLILDEPENHLHPAWQSLLAEVIVLLQKEYRLHVLIDTHSPNMLLALRRYAFTYRVADDFRLYRAKNAPDGLGAEVEGGEILAHDGRRFKTIMEELSAPTFLLAQEQYAELTENEDGADNDDVD